MLNPIFYANRGGIPTLESRAVTVTDANVQFSFRNHRYVGAPYRGLIIIRLSQSIPTGTTTTLPIVFTSEGTNARALTGYNDEPITVGDISGTGVYLAWYDQSSGTLQLMTGIV